MDKMKELYEKVAHDSDLQAKFTRIMERFDGEKPDEFKERLLAFAAEAGYTIDYEEIKNFFEGMSLQPDGELSESELDAVAGGKNSERVKHSLTSLGSYCAALSAKYAITNNNCGAQF